MSKTTPAGAPFSVPLEETILELSSEIARGRFLAQDKDSFLRALHAIGWITHKERRTPAKRLSDYRLTDEGKEADASIRAYRKLESDGLPLKDWTTEREPGMTTLEQWLEYAIYEAGNTTENQATHYSDGTLLLQGPHPQPGKLLPGNGMIGMHLFLDAEKWEVTRIRPIGYFFRDIHAIIAFDQEDLYIQAPYYEIVCRTTAQPRTWYALKAVPGNPLNDSGSKQHTVIRVDNTEGSHQALIAPYWYSNNRTPAGIARILKKLKKSRAPVPAN